MVWRSRGKFDEANAYGFDYDVMSRLKQAYFTQSTAVNTSSGGWNQNKNFTTDNLNYDENGNILNMRNQSTAFGTTRTVDDLTYSYNTNSNRLTRVQDNGNGTPATNQIPGIAGAGGLKDFKDGTNTGDDYTYDANGNIISDANKNFTATYNHLDKPERIMLENNPNKDIRYVYDATGERLQKIVRHNDTVRTTTYVDGLTYLNDTSLLFFAHDGGRTRRNYKGRLVNDYFIEDHLGNTRMVLTDERDTVAYLAAFETNRDALENAVWRNRNTTRETIASNNAFFNNPNPNAQYSRLNGSDANRRKGPGLVLKVMAGDTLNITTRALYNAANVPNTIATVNDMITSVLTGFLGAASGNAAIDNKAWLQSNNGVVVNTNALNNFITNNQNNNSNNNTPRAYLKYLLFDEDFKLVQGFAERIDNGAGTVHTYNAGGQLVVPKNGFIYVFTTNESPVDVWFDDINVIHRTGPLLQESSFYPFGMEITPLSSYAAIKVPNERDYQKNELDEEFGLELHYFDARMYDAQVGRFGGVDPVMESYMKANPYHYNFNNPLFYIDQDGREPVTIALAIKIGLKALFKFGKKAVAKYVLPGKAMAAPTKVAWATGAASNIYQNRHHITNGTVAGGIFRALGYGIAGGTGAAISMGKGALWSLGGMAAGGMMTAGWAGLTDAEGANFWQFFSRGASSAMFGKNFGKAFGKGYYANPSNQLPMAEGVEAQYSGFWKKAKKIAGEIGQKSFEKGAQSYFNKYGIYGKDGTKKYGERFYWHALWTGAVAGGFNASVDLGLKSLATSTISSGWKNIFTGGTNLINAYATDRLKFTMMFNNSEKKYRQFLSENRSMNRLWSFSNAAGLMAMFFEGYEY